ncbi:MAG: translation elongation factor Ts [Christensenellales bacterium]|jgi:elongation factor Ts
MSFTAQDVQKLRASTGVGLMDCKKALQETDGNMDKAVDYLREKGIAKAAKKADRVASQGIVDAYIHMNGKIGVLLEVNCETDFVARGEAFRTLAHDIALQIAASKPSYIDKDEVPKEEIEKEKSILKAQALNEPNPKPEKIIEKMIEGRVEKYYKEVCLLEQPYVKDPAKTIRQLINESIMVIGEKISVRRFVRFEMGEGLEKKKDNFADEINEQVAKMKAE